VKRVLAAALVLAAAALAVVLALNRGSGDARATPTYYADVKPILDGRCAGCHYDGGIAPFPLTSFGEARARRLALADAVLHRRMPPWHAERGVRRYRHDPSLTDGQIRTIADWAAARAPAGDPDRAAPALAPVAARLSRADVRLRMPEAYTPRPREDADDYRCFVLDWSPGAATHVTGVNVTPGRPEEVHHIILYLAPPGTGRTLAAWEAADARAGYECYGGPSATGADGSLRAPQFVAGWVPGSSGGDLPAGTGLPIPPGSRLILQVHYNLDGAGPAPDRSAVELALAEEVERPGLYVPLVNPLWLLSPRSFSIPAGHDRVEHAFEVDPRPFARLLAPALDLGRGFEIHRVALHMHRLGANGQVAVVRDGGADAVLLAVPDWDFHWQREYALAAPARVRPGDRLSIRCEHDNSAANQPAGADGAQAEPRDVTWGEDSSDEMCIAFLYVTGR
jgi:hypothetical protein